MPVVMMSGHATIETAVAATKLGALSFLEKPITLQKLMQAVDAGLKKSSHKTILLDQANPAENASGAFASSEQPAVPSVQNQQAVLMPVKASNSLPRSADFLLKLNQPLREAKEQFDVAYFTYHLEIEHGSVARVAEKTGLERTHLYRKLKQLGIDTARNKPAHD
jgi:DNA-binding NtrC family response regulator